MMFLLATIMTFAATATVHADFYFDGTIQEQPLSRLVITNSTYNGQLLSGAVFGIYRAGENELLTELTTNDIGKAQVILPQGHYHILIITPASGYAATTDWVSAVITEGETHALTIFSVPLAPIVLPFCETDECEEITDTEVIVEMIEVTAVEATPTAPPMRTSSRPIHVTQSVPVETQPANVTVITRAEQSGNPILGVAFGVYRTSDNAKLTEFSTDINGTASVSLALGEYYLRNYSVPLGFLTEQSRIFIIVTDKDTVTVEVTIQRDWNIPYVDSGIITLPPTGELLPVVNYFLGSLFIITSLLLFITIIKKWGKNHVYST